MAISGDYSAPVTVNGFTCKNCTDVDYAKKHIDPAHPKDGPYGVAKADHENASTSKAETNGGVTPADRTPAVTFGGQLAALNVTLQPGANPSSSPAYRLDVSV